MGDRPYDETFHDNASHCHFAGIVLGYERMPDATTLLHLLHLIEDYILVADIAVRAQHIWRASSE
jgi:hypothetical protein